MLAYGQQVQEVTEEDDNSEGSRAKRAPQADMNTSLLSVKSHMANGINEYVDHDELEAIAMCYDNIRKIRKDVGLPSNNDSELAE
jgi:hypothetical protein